MNVDFERLARARFARVAREMEARGTDLLLLSRYPNGHYACGARRVQVAGSGGFVPWVVVRAHDPAPYAYTPDLDGIPAWMAERGRTLCWNPAALVADLREIAGGRCRKIAFDTVTPHVRAMLVEAFPAAEWQDGEELLAAAKSVKLADEITCLERAHEIAEATLGRVIAAMRPGVSERELRAVYLRAAIQEGASFLAHGGIFEAVSDTVLLDGDLVYLEAAVFWNGYQGECARTWFVAGERRPSQAQRELYGRWREALGALVEACRPGASAAELLRALPGGVIGNPYLIRGIGTGLEWPFLTPGPGAKWALREGMVLVVSPRAGMISGSETIIVEERGSRRLGRLPGGWLE